MLDSTVIHLTTDVADAWIIGCGDGSFEYSYGGTRRVHPEISDAAVEVELLRLMLYESHFKNEMINRCLEEGALDHFRDHLPSGFLFSRVAGGRCLFRPRDNELYQIMGNPSHACFEDAVRILFAQVASVLNRQQGRIKLTPDFGKFSGVSDILHDYTPHVLGIRKEDGGCAGKASYTTTGVIAALQYLDVGEFRDRAVTIIGADGAVGSGITDYFATNGFRDLKVSDISYSDSSVIVGSASTSRRTAGVLPSEWGRFTNECLGRAGLIVASTWGDELMNSDLASIPRGSLLLLAHNNALPTGARGRAVVDELEARGVSVIPGQVLTLGGALTTRLEWYSREAGVAEFPKQLAHQIVATVTQYLLARLRGTPTGPTTCYSESCDFAGI